MNWVKPIELKGGNVLLRPTALADADQLHEVCAPDTFRFYTAFQPRDASVEAFRDYLAARLELPNTISWVIVDLATDQLIGETSFMDIREPARGLEIGMTWIAPTHRGTAVNPQVKLLQLQHAFEDLNAIRVTLKTDAENLHSQAAIRKLGGIYEGTLRKHGFRRDGSTRDTAYFGITDDEWPEVKNRLHARLESLRNA